MHAEIEQLDKAGRWPKQFAEMTDIITDELAEVFPSLEPDEIRRAGVRCIYRFAREFGGSNAYMPKLDVLERTLRDLKIWSEHDGTADGPNGIYALSKRYSLSSQAIWAILRKQRALHRAKANGTAVEGS